MESENEDDDLHSLAQFFFRRPVQYSLGPFKGSHIPLFKSLWQPHRPEALLLLQIDSLGSLDIWGPYIGHCKPIAWLQLPTSYKQAAPNTDI